jgi:hypothetical protein
VPELARSRTNLDKRLIDNPSIDYIDSWHRSLVSSYPGQEWDVEGDGSDHFYYHDGILGEGQYIYTMDEGVDLVRIIYLFTHVCGQPADNLTRQDIDLVAANIDHFDAEHSIYNGKATANFAHGTQVSLYAIGHTLGIAPRATLVHMAFDSTMDGDALKGGGDEVELVRLLSMIKHIESNQREGKCVINMPLHFSIPPYRDGLPNEEWQDRFRKFSLVSLFLPSL